MQKGYKKNFAGILVLAICIIGFIALQITLAQTQIKQKPSQNTQKTEAQEARIPDVAGIKTTVGSDIQQNIQMMINDGQKTFRYDTFGDEAFWGDQLQIHEAIAGAKLGGVGNGVSPKIALSVGLKVDADALPADLVSKIKAGTVNLDDPATTIALLKQNSVVGLTGFFDNSGNLKSVGVQCALCHSTVDNSVSAGIGHRLDGWPNRDLDVGQVINLAPNLRPFVDLLGVDEATVRKVITSWGPGKFDAELILDGKGFRPDGKTAATLIPPAYGLGGSDLQTWTGWGSIPYWNAFVANLEMHGQGTFYDPRLNNKLQASPATPARYKETADPPNNAYQFPIAAKAGFGNVRNSPDLITPKLAALQYYQLSIPPPIPASDSYNKAAANRGQAIFNNKAKCASCHVPPNFSEPGWNMHTAQELGIDDFQSSRSPDNRYVTPSLKGVSTHAKGGFFHDGRFATLEEVINHFDQLQHLGLTDAEKSDLAEYLKSM